MRKAQALTDGAEPSGNDVSRTVPLMSVSMGTADSWRKNVHGKRHLDPLEQQVSDRSESRHAVVTNCHTQFLVCLS